MVSTGIIRFFIWIFSEFLVFNPRPAVALVIVHHCDVFTLTCQYFLPFLKLGSYVLSSERDNPKFDNYSHQTHEQRYNLETTCYLNIIVLLDGFHVFMA